MTTFRMLLCTLVILAVGSFSQAQAVPPPKAPTVVLTWDALPAAVSFNVWRWTAGQNGFAKVNVTPVVSPATGTPTFSDTTGVLGTKYSYYVTAVNTAGESAPSAQVDVTVIVPVSIPGIPTGLKVTVIVTQ